MNIDEIINELREAERAVRGNGFGYAGDLKAEYRMAIRRFESLKAKLSEAPPPEEVKSLEAANSDCFGYGSDNALGCNCRKVFKVPVREQNNVTER